MKFGIVVCSRLSSRRVPAKCAIELNGKTILHHLHDRLRKANVPVIYAVPDSERTKYLKLCKTFSDPWFVFAGCESDPMLRMLKAAESHGLDAVIRVTHDKIFLDDDTIKSFMTIFATHDLEYLYSSTFPEGTGFEIISTDTLRRACEKYSDVEHISYAVKNVADRKRTRNIVFNEMDVKPRLLIDFPEDVDLMNSVLSILGNDCSLTQVLQFFRTNPWALKINKMPEVTVYTCAHNAEKWIEKCMGSISAQKSFKDFEYILVDDASTDKTAQLMSRFSTIYQNVKYVRNASNLGLASSSNIALSMARGKYIIRLDADDYFTDKMAIRLMKGFMDTSGCDAVYPNNYFGSMKQVQSAEENHHVGGALFKVRAMNHVKFTEGLRGYEGYDFFERARTMLEISYYQKPLFFYTQRPGSLSKTNLSERNKIREDIDVRVAALATSQVV